MTKSDKKRLIADLRELVKASSESSLLLEEDEASREEAELRKYWLERAVNLLVRRDHSEIEFRQKLKQKGCPDRYIAFIIEYCYEHQYLDESRFTTSYVRSKASRGYGPEKIRYELQQHGITKSEIALALREQDWTEAKTVAMRKIGEHPPMILRKKMFARGFLQDS